MRKGRPPSDDEPMKHELSVSGGALRSSNVFRELRKQEETYLAGKALKLQKASTSVQHSEHPCDAADQGGIIAGGTRPRLPAEYLGDLVRRPLSKLSHGDRRQVSLCWLKYCVPRSLVRFLAGKFGLSVDAQPKLCVAFTRHGLSDTLTWALCRGRSSA